MIELQHCFIPKATNKKDIYISWNGSETPGESHHVLRINKKTVYQDLTASKVKIAAFIVDAVQNVNIHVPSTLLHEDTHVIEHVLSKIVNQFFPSPQTVNMTLCIVHQPFSQKLQDVVVKLKKVIGARAFAMMPSNVATPDYIAQEFKKTCNKLKRCKVTIYDDKMLEKEGFGLISAIGNSGASKPRFVFIERRGKPGCPVIAIAGKGITFDSGGLAVKSLRDMVDMKYDKIGAIYGFASLLYFLEDPEYTDITFVGAFPLAENVISGVAVKPGDVIRSYNGKTVEIVNPDAEGRLVLADAFAFLDKYKPSLLVDVATLTGHAQYINCWHSGYYYASDRKTKTFIEAMTDLNGERMLPMPTWQDYDNVLQSDVADLANSPLKCSDSFVATLFLKQFVPKSCSWVHIDLAHEFSVGSPPVGNGIRTIIDTIEWYLQPKK